MSKIFSAVSPYALKPCFYAYIKSAYGNVITLSDQNKFMYMGQTCLIENSGLAEVIGFQNNETLIMPYQNGHGIVPGSKVFFADVQSSIAPSNHWIGRVLNAVTHPIDGKGFLPEGDINIPLHPEPLKAYQRQRVKDPLDVGIGSINTFLTCCIGQRMGIFSGSGVGKSMLLSMLARYTECDVCVIGLIGERGREVREFIEDTLGEEGLKKSIMVVATSDESPLLRRRAAYTTLTIAEYFRDQGQHVLCLFDSVTRFALSQKEIGLACGETPSLNGYPPSVLGELSRLLERAGPGVKGMITAFFSVLVEGDDTNEPIADAVRGILDGHIVLDRFIAERGRFPAIHILKSISRMVPYAHSTDEQKIIQRARFILSQYEDMADMIRLGAYKNGSNPELDQAIELYPKIEEFLTQHYLEKIDKEKAFLKLREIIEPME